MRTITDLASIILWVTATYCLMTNQGSVAPLIMVAIAEKLRNIPDDLFG